jgi:hypothetical protein
MNNSNSLDLMVEALTAFVQEDAAHRTPPVPGLPTLREVLADAGALPREALFLGLAEDGLPVLLNLYDPIPGPILVSGDQASGKTALLQMVARGVELLHMPDEVQYAIVSPYPHEWNKFKENPNNSSLCHIQDEHTKDLLYSLVTWAHNNKGDKNSVILLIDNLEEFAKLDEETVQNLRWLLLRGPTRRVWPIVTVNSSRVAEINDWLGFFRTRLFGCTQDAQDAQYLTRTPDYPLDDLVAGSQFTMREGKQWLKFWMPTIE